MRSTPLELINDGTATTCVGLCCCATHITPWQALRKSRDNNAYIVTVSFDVQTFEYILENGFAERRNNQPVPRNDVPMSAPKPQDPSVALLTLLASSDATMRTKESRLTK